MNRVHSGCGVAMISGFMDNNNLIDGWVGERRRRKGTEEEQPQVRL